MTHFRKPARTPCMHMIRSLRWDEIFRICFIMALAAFVVFGLMVLR